MLRICERERGTNLRFRRGGRRHTNTMDSLGSTPFWPRRPPGTGPHANSSRLRSFNFNNVQALSSTHRHFVPFRNVPSTKSFKLKKLKKRSPSPGTPRFFAAERSIPSIPRSGRRSLLSDMGPSRFNLKSEFMVDFFDPRGQITLQLPSHKFEQTPCQPARDLQATLTSRFHSSRTNIHPKSFLPSSNERCGGFPSSSKSETTRTERSRRPCGSVHGEQPTVYFYDR